MITIDREFSKRLGNAALLKAPSVWNALGHKATTTFAVENPATCEQIAHVPDFSRAAIKSAIDVARTAQKSWSRLTAKDRADRLKRRFGLWHDNLEDLALILTMEQGKPLAEARGEIRYGASYVEWFAEEARRLYGDIIPAPVANQKIMVTRQPVGVVAAITPWNFPNAMMARKVAPALAAGCAIVAKPAAETPLSTIAIANLAEQAGIPVELFCVLPMTDAPAFGDEVTSNPYVAKITFTGSTEVGRRLMEQGARQIKRFGLELGGNAPLIVFDDADLEKAIEGTIAAKFRNAGQTCVCANRIYVQSGIHDRFVQALSDRVETLTVGNGADPATAIGPLINPASIKKVERLLEDARTNGAKIIKGGQPVDRPGHFFRPTIISDVDCRMAIAREEIFGPVAPIFRFETEKEVLDLANDTEFGLAAYVFSSDIGCIFRVAEELETGMVGMNTGVISTEVAPFGGVKQSGLGREGSKYGLDDYIELKYICLAT
ncbi:MAG: succinate-semialdehyde dehydrogenase (NADP(+)) [Rhizobiales bacterium]|nr:succinate-semialdehyde dehydrogenase (NADP(+)) [Hyphomicrobiales bacterium]|tara:strand:+ start:7717 stop:9189 length:1473 start_codon:yes stop_codon:yes gene_type:complete